MKTSLFRAALAVCLLGSAAAIATMAPTVAIAADEGRVSVPVGKLLSDAQKLLIAGDFANAKVLILQAQALPDQTPFDTYKINQFLGNASIKLNDHPTADASFEAMADSPAMPDADKANTLRVASLLATEAKHYDKAIKYGNAYIALGTPPADNVLLATMAEAYFYTNDFANAETYAQKSLAATPAGKAPDRGALEVVLGAQLKQNKKDEAIKTLETIVTYYDDPDEWNQLTDQAIVTHGISNVELLDIYRLRMATKATSTSDDYATGASVAVQLAYPVEAEAMINAGGGGARGAADIHARAARDRASLQQFISLAQKSPSGEYDLKVAETYYGYGRYADAEAAARIALAKGGPKNDPNQSNMVLGMALAMQGKNADAAAAFANVHGGAGMMKAAELWTLFVNRKTATTAAQ